MPSSSLPHDTKALFHATNLMLFTHKQEKNTSFLRFTISTNTFYRHINLSGNTPYGTDSNKNSLFIKAHFHYHTSAANKHKYYSHHPIAITSIITFRIVIRHFTPLAAKVLKMNTKQGTNITYAQT